MRRVARLAVPPENRQQHVQGLNNRSVKRASHVTGPAYHEEKDRDELQRSKEFPVHGVRRLPFPHPLHQQRLVLLPVEDQGGQVGRAATNQQQVTTRRPIHGYSHQTVDSPAGAKETPVSGSIVKSEGSERTDKDTENVECGYPGAPVHHLQQDAHRQQDEQVGKDMVGVVVDQAVAHVPPHLASILP